MGLMFLLIVREEGGGGGGGGGGGQGGEAVVHPTAQVQAVQAVMEAQEPWLCPARLYSGWECGG